MFEKGSKEEKAAAAAAAAEERRTLSAGSFLSQKRTRLLSLARVSRGVERALASGKDGRTKQAAPPRQKEGRSGEEEELESARGSDEE